MEVDIILCLSLNEIPQKVSNWSPPKAHGKTQNQFWAMGQGDVNIFKVYF